MQTKPKFKCGDIVKHRAAKKSDALRLLVTGVGEMITESSEEIIYQVSGEKVSYVPRDDTHVRIILPEYELEIFPT